ncbi:hypothetical protein AX15_004201 [Amanita polypyramis BW_CC]|nr:hypothetical protein AX15_004201 [Amanita polypyramis BW_CC]
MLKVSFVFAALLAANLVVNAEPVGSGDEFSRITPHAVKTPGREVIQFQRRSVLEDLYSAVIIGMTGSKNGTQPTSAVPAPASSNPAGEQDAAKSDDSSNVDARSFYGVDDLQGRDYWEMPEEELERRGLDDGLSDLEARGFYDDLEAREFDVETLEARDSGDYAALTRRDAKHNGHGNHKKHSHGHVKKHKHGHKKHKNGKKHGHKNGRKEHGHGKHAHKKHDHKKHGHKKPAHKGHHDKHGHKKAHDHKNHGHGGHHKGHKSK